MSTSTRPASSRSRPRGAAGSCDASSSSEPILRCAGVRRAFSPIAASIRRTATSGNSPPARRGRPASRPWYAMCPPGPAEGSGSTNTGSSRPDTTACRPAADLSIRAESSPDRLRPRNLRTADTRSGGNATCSRWKRTMEPSGRGSGNTAPDPPSPGFPVSISSSRVVSSSTAKRSPVDAGAVGAERLGAGARFRRMPVGPTWVSMHRFAPCRHRQHRQQRVLRQRPPCRAKSRSRGRPASESGSPRRSDARSCLRVGHTSPVVGGLADPVSTARWHKCSPGSTGGFDREMRSRFTDLLRRTPNSVCAQYNLLSRLLGSGSRAGE